MSRDRLLESLKVTMVLAVTGFLAGMVAVTVALAFGSAVGAAVVLRGTLVLLAVLLVATRLRVTTAALAVGAVGGYLLDPFSWSGVAVFTQLAVDAGPVSFVLDALLWVTVAVLGGALAARRVVEVRPMATPYG